MKTTLSIGAAMMFVACAPVKLAELPATHPANASAKSRAAVKLKPIESTPAKDPQRELEETHEHKAAGEHEGGHE